MKNICDWNNCSEIGEYKAPVEKDNSKNFRLLCLSHIKEFNKNWNYFSGMSEEQICEFIKSDMTWHKPTQSFSSSDNFFKILWNNALKDEIDKSKFNSQFSHMKQFRFSHNDVRAFSVLGLSVGLKWKKIQEKFKKLVKKFHPDMNLGNKKYEDKLKVITLAYTQLKNTYRIKKLTPNLNIKPDIRISVKQSFGIESDMEVNAFSKKNEFVPEIDKDYKFDRDTTLAILSGFNYNKKVIVHGYHGTGKSTHITQVAARLNWPCLRINLDSHISRIDLIGKDAIVIKNGKQVTEFKEGILPWAFQNPVALVFDEYDAGRPDVMFVLQRILESDGYFTLLDKNKVVKQNEYFRLFATANTIGLGDTTGLYTGTQQINQAQMDRWNIVTTLNYLSLEKEMEIILAKNKNLNSTKGKEKVANMIKVASLTRKGFMAGDISTVMSPRTVLFWAENSEIFKDTGYAFRVTFLNKCEDVEKNIIAEYYQRCFGEDLPESLINTQI